VSGQRRRVPRRRIIGANWEAQQPRRGRPPAERQRKATRIYLTKKQRAHWLDLVEVLASLGAARIDVADLAISYLEQVLNEIQSGLTGESQVLPVGVVDLKSLYFLLDLRPTTGEAKQFTITMFTETREKMSVMTVRLQSLFRATWSQVFGLAIELFYQRLSMKGGRLNVIEQMEDLDSFRDHILRPQQLEFSTL
jgi:hypothetical protein